jgi:hypothetical protein
MEKIELEGAGLCAKAVTGGINEKTENGRLRLMQRLQIAQPEI